MTARKNTKTWLDGLEPPLRPIANTLDRTIRDADPELINSIKWGNPACEKQGLVCYLAATKVYVSLGFFNGAALADPEGILEGKGKKLRHIKVRALSDIHGERISVWVREAVTLNQGVRVS